MYKLEKTIVWRTYLGGALISQFNEGKDTDDSHYPEDWLASVVSAINPPQYSKKDEGLSQISGENIFLKDLIERDPERMLGAEFSRNNHNCTGVLMKLLDSAERLTIQVHPTKAKAFKFFGSKYGKTEAWYIIKTREINNTQPYVLIGFNETTTKEKWADAFYNQDIDALCSMLSRKHVKEGDVIIVDGGVPHAIGEGCLILEIQEPSDLTLRVERTTPSGLTIDDALIHQGIGFEKMLKCFEYDGAPDCNVYPSLISKTNSAELSEVIAYDRTKCFSLYKLHANGFVHFAKNDVFCIAIITSGSGTIILGNENLSVKQGDRFFVAASDDELDITGKNLEILIGFGPCEASVKIFE